MIVDAERNECAAPYEPITFRIFREDDDAMEELVKHLDDQSPDHHADQYDDRGYDLKTLRQQMKEQQSIQDAC
jgi:hypothetical protein